MKNDVFLNITSYPHFYYTLCSDFHTNWSSSATTNVIHSLLINIYKHKYNNLCVILSMQRHTFV